MSAYDNIKNDKNASFFNFPNDEFRIKSFKNQWQYYCVPEFQYNQNSHINIQNHDILPKNSYSNVPFVNGDKIDFELDNKNNLLYHKLYLSFDLKNENDVNALNLLNSNLLIEKISLLKNGNEISSNESYYLWIKNMEHYQPNNVLHYSDQLNVSETDFNNNNAIAVNTTKTFLIDLHCSLRKSNILVSLPQNLTLRIKFRKNVILSGLVTDSDVIVSNLKIVAHYLEVPNYSVSNILSHPQLNIFHNKPLYYNRILNNITNNSETYIEIDIKHHISKLKIFLTDSNASNANYLNFYGIKDLYINDSSGINIFNGKKINDNEHKLNLYETYYPVDKYWFYRKKTGLYVINFSAFGDVSDSQSYISSRNFKAGIYRLYFVPTQTVATSVTVNVIAYIPSLITVKKDGEFVETYN